MSSELRTARRGHHLLKDKRDGLMQRFLEILDETLAKRREVDRLLKEAADSMAIASSVIEPEVLLQTMQLRTEPLEVNAETRNVMSVSVPEFSLPDIRVLPSSEEEAEETADGEQESEAAERAEETADEEEPAEDPEEEESKLIGYGMVHTTGDIDIAFDALTNALKPMLELASLEKTLQVLAVELENTRRRVNSLEHVLIPELTETIREIRMKMDENERDNLTRLMKVKDMLVEEEIMARRKANEEACLPDHLLKQQEEEAEADDAPAEDAQK